MSGKAEARSLDSVIRPLSLPLLLHSSYLCTGAGPPMHWERFQPELNCPCRLCFCSHRLCKHSKVVSGPKVVSR